MYELYPELDDIRGQQEQIDALLVAIREAWAKLPPEFVRLLIWSIPTRLQACIDAEGWQTKY